jgi:putative nucleotidyltransferase with HDIG domain
MLTVRRDHPQVEVIVITGCGSLETAAAGIRSGVCDYIQKPFDAGQVSASVDRALVRQRARNQLGVFLEELGGVVGRDREVAAILGDVRRSELLQAQLSGILESNNAAERRAPDEPPQTLAFLEALADTIEIRDPHLSGHARRVAYYATLLAERVQLSTADPSQLRISALLHDIGKLGVPTELLSRETALLPAEREVIEQHSEIGSRLLEPLDLPSAVVTAVHHHHEWWDGTGYPDGLAGEQIPRDSRIIAIADAFDTMSNGRGYRAALDHDAIEREFERFAGIQFDPDLVKEFLAILESGEWELDADLVADVIAETRTTGPRDAAAS